MLDESFTSARSERPALYQLLQKENAGLQLSSELDPSCLHRRFKETGRLHIPNFFHEPSAEMIAAALEKSTRWNIVTDNNGRHLDLDAKGMAALPAPDKTRFYNAVHEQARWNFQYLFGNFPIYDSYHGGKLEKGVIYNLFEFLNGPIFLGFMRKVIDDRKIKFADAQATKYEAGHFLTEHDDGIGGKRRRCAYVLNFTREWRTDWGGLLQFHNADGHVDEAFMPRFNALNILKVPQKHSVSVVAPFAGAARYSITGWLRAGADPNRKGAKA